MKILVFSDSHSRPERMFQVLDTISADLVFHLGDGQGDVDLLRARYPALPVLAVRGNCDSSFSGLRDWILTQECGKKFFLLHGHQLGVKTSLTRAVMAAREQEADVLLFGHTHEPLVDRCGDFYAMNPGSIGLGSSRGKYTYGIITVERGLLSCSTAEAKEVFHA